MASLSNPAQIYDYSVTLGTATMACPANSSRSFLMIQNTGTSTAVFSFTNPAPGAGSAGCFQLGSGSPPLLFSPVVPNGPLYVQGTGGELVIAQG